MLLKECSLAQYTCVTCLSVSTSNACLHFPFQHMWAHTPILFTGASSTTHHWFHLTVLSHSHCNNVSVQAISGWLSCRLFVKSWVSFSMDRCDVFLPKQRISSVTATPGLVRGINDAFDFLIIHFSSSTLANHRDMKVLFYQAAPVCKAHVWRTKNVEESKSFCLRKILALFTAPCNCRHTHD